MKGVILLETLSLNAVRAVGWDQQLKYPRSNKIHPLSTPGILH